MQGQGQGHDMSIVLVEFQGGGVLRQGVQVHAEKIHSKLAIDVVEFIFIFAEFIFQVLFIHFFEVVEIVRALRVDTLMDGEVFAVFLGDKGAAAMRATEFRQQKTALIRREPGITDFAQELPFGAIVLVKEWLGGITARTGAVIRDVAIGAAAYGADHLAVTFFVVREEILVSPVLPEVSDQRKLINFEFLVLGRMRIIKSPLFERDVSANKVD